MVPIRTGIIIGGGDIGCCSLGDRILVMSGPGPTRPMMGDAAPRYWMEGRNFERNSLFAAFVDVGDGMLSEETVHVTRLTTTGAMNWSDGPFLCQVSESRALLSFGRPGSVWYCDIAGEIMTIREVGANLPAQRAFSIAPIRLPGGKLLAARSDASSTFITLITCDEEPRFDEVESIPGVGNCRASLVLFRDRFVLGFGRESWSGLSGVWIFDIQTRRGSQLRKAREWHLSLPDCFITVQDDALYLFDGNVDVVPLSLLSEHIRRGAVRFSFSRCLGLRFTPRQCFSRRMANRYFPLVL